MLVVVINIASGMPVGGLQGKSTNNKIKFTYSDSANLNSWHLWLCYISLLHLCLWYVVLQRHFFHLDTGCNGVVFVQMKKREGDPSPREKGILAPKILCKTL